MGAHPSTSPLPWRLNDLLSLYAIGVGGVTAVLVSWWGAASTGRDSTQVAYAVVGIAGVIALGTANAFWLLTGRRAVGIRRRALVQAFGEVLGDEVGEATPDVVAAHEGTIVLVAVPNGHRYHRVGCPLVEQKQMVTATSQRHEAQGRMPCGLCAP